MKKIFLLSIISLILCGCTNIQKDSFDNIIKNSLNSNINLQNTDRSGYHFYLPRGLSIKESKPYNDIITNKRYDYYLYVDLISYNSQVNFNYNLNNEAYYSQSINYDNKMGYIEINNYKNDQYLIEIMYNYAKIEVVVYEDDIKEAVAYAMSILSSITYNDNVIAQKLANNEFFSTEEQFDIFEIVGSDNYLEFSTEIESDEEINDPDYIKEGVNYGFN